MNIVFVSNFYNHHQAYISKQLYKLTNGGYRFIATAEIPKERIELGYSDGRDPFVLQYGDNEAQDQIIQEQIDSADIVIIGSAPENLLKNRKKEKKIIFRYSERPLKNGFQWWKYPLRLIRWHYNNPFNVPIYMLCASAYTAQDYSKFFLFKDKMFKWGYFPEIKRYNDINSIMAKKNTSEILWCGRFLDWKHPDAVLTVAKKLKQEGYNFHINIIGTGNMEETLKKSCSQNGLDDIVSFLGSMSPEEVRAYMERAGMYLFTSDRKEGWGAVLNEAMNSVCAVIASTEAGATPYLVKNNFTGLVYNNCDIEELYEKVKYLLDNPKEQIRLGMSAYDTIISEWNAEEAAKRLMHLFKIILSKNKCEDLYGTGPCSRGLKKMGSE